MPSATTQLMMYKTLSAFGVTTFSSIPVVFAVIEPMTWADVQARWVYLTISVLSAFVTLSVFQPLNAKELAGRILAAAVASLAFVEPVARQIRPYMTDITLQDGAPIAAAMPAAVFIGIVAWFCFGFVVWAVKSPRRAFRIVFWWKSPSWATFNAVFADDVEVKDHPAPGNETIEEALTRMIGDKEKAAKLVAMIHSMTAATPVTSTNGATQGQPVIGVTLIPAQEPAKTLTPGATGSADASTKTTG
jgi:hypothetical protein